jgi:hypothetical protein
MLSSVLHSETAILVNIAIIRAFVHFRRILELDSVLRRKIEELEKNLASHDEKINLVFQAIKQLIEKNDEPLTPRKRIGYTIEKNSQSD